MNYITSTRPWLKVNWRSLKECGDDLSWSSWGEKEYLQELPCKFDLSFAAYADELVGFCIVSEKENSPYLHLFMIKTSFRGKGKAQNIWKELCRRLKRKGYNKLRWKVKQDNIRALNFYAKFAPQQIGKEGEHLLFEVALKRVISAHQPNFMPWYPFFQKIQNSDVCVLLTNSEFTKGSYLNRFHDEARKWYTMSIIQKGSRLPINEKKYLYPQKDWDTIKRKLPSYEPILSQFDEDIGVNLAETNVKIIRKICKMLGIHTQIVLDAERETRSTDRLVEIAKEYKADVYLSGPSGKDYLALDKFEKEKIEVLFSDQGNVMKPILHVLNQEEISA